MPADSERPDPATAQQRLPRTWRPLGPRIAGIVFGGALLVVFGVAWVTLGAENRAKFTPFQIGTMVVLTALGYAVIYALVRSRVVAEPDRLVIVNGYRRRELDWAEVVAIRLPPGAPWATLDLSDGTTVSAMGIQGSDGARAQQAVREIRTLADRLG
ncbi:PH domain-containing protein [Nocardioides pantholopis]|uniref:PH domain-containing protein n=1 Tax=Nocardioides pantholopis TaxID=2483798 RepID=UPI000F09010D|nr:PH domain-containing protein [Nocardioides pantholopis]